MLALISIQCVGASQGLCPLIQSLRWWIIVCLVGMYFYIGTSLICCPRDGWQFLLFGWIIPLTHCSALQLFFHHTWDLQQTASLSLPLTTTVRHLPMTSLKVSRIQTSNPGTQTTHTRHQKARGSRWSCQLRLAAWRPRQQVKGSFSVILYLPDCSTLVKKIASRNRQIFCSALKPQPHPFLRDLHSWS